jgi:hypothetical protein
LLAGIRAGGDNPDNLPAAREGHSGMRSEQGVSRSTRRWGEGHEDNDRPLTVAGAAQVAWDPGGS